MIRIEEDSFKIEEAKGEEELDHVVEHITERPSVVDAKVYKLRSGFVKQSVYITLGYVEQNGRKRPIEIFINSKDLTKNAEYAVLTRLISAIFRKSANPTFILEELSSIHDPNGGYHRNGKFIHSFYSEVADVIENFLKEIDLIETKGEKKKTIQSTAPVVSATTDDDAVAFKDTNSVEGNFKICPDCSSPGLKLENGCETCMFCGYSKCDK